MKLNLYKDSIENYRLSVKVLAVTAAAMVVLTIAMAFIAVRAAEKTRIVLVPPKLKDPVLIGDEVVSRQYLVTMGRYSLDLIGTFTYASVEHQFESFLQMVAPENYAKIKSYLLKQADVVKKQKIVQAFIIQDLKITTLRKEIKIPFGGKKTVPAPPKGKVIATGYMFRRISSGPIVDKGFYKVTLFYLVRYGQFQITGIKFQHIKKKSVEKQILERKRKEKGQGK